MRKPWPARGGGESSGEIAPRVSSVGAGNTANNGLQAMTGAFSESATLVCCSSGSSGNSAERAQGQSAPQVCLAGMLHEELCEAQQLFATDALGCAQQDFFAEDTPDFLHWQLTPVPHPPQQALAFETVRQPCAVH